MTVRVGLVVTPLRAPRGPAVDRAIRVWDVTAEENASGTRHAVGRVTCRPADATRCARELAAQRRPDFVVVSVIVEPTFGGSS